MRMTRKEFLVGTAGLSLTGAASPVKSMLGTRAIESEGEVFENPYVTDGLIAMWDGEWNAGPGRHDGNAEIWRDIVGNTIATPYVHSGTGGGFGWGDNCLSTSNGCVFKTQVGVGLTSCTVEVVSLIRGTNGITSLVGSFGTPQVAADGSSNNGGIVLGWYNYSNDAHTFWFASSPWSRRYIWHVGSNTVGRVLSVVWEGGNLPCYFFMDGTLKDYNEQSTLGMNMLPFCIGATHSTGNEYLWGDFYNVRVYERALSEEEVLANYEVDVERFGL